MSSKKMHDSVPGLLEIYASLLGKFGHRGWWPGETPFEVCIGAILTQSTAWTNVEKAISNLKSAGLMDAIKMHSAGEKTIAGLIRPAGYFNIKASRISAFLDFLSGEFNGDLSRVSGLGIIEARRKLLGVKGIGPETADSILLYALDFPVFVVDAYTRRVFSRIGLLRREETYEEVQVYFMTRLPRDAALFNDFHAQIVELGKRHCKKSGPICLECPVLSCCKKRFV